MSTSDKQNRKPLESDLFNHEYDHRPNWMTQRSLTK